VPRQTLSHRPAFQFAEANLPAATFAVFFMFFSLKPAHARCLGLPALSADIQFGFNILADVVVRKMSLNESAEHVARHGKRNPQHETLFERRRDSVTK